MTETSTCDMPGCDRPIYAKGACQAHYRRRYRKLKETPRARKDSAQLAAPVRRYDVDLVDINTRVTRETFKQLTRDGSSCYAKSSEILERWAKRQGRAHAHVGAD